uniref:Rad60/SUMO-like domain-containing protein n=1 Tax=Brassica oleracea var. oleracea TaxID=109376 RepID=A0A0D3E0V2_BRAOL
MNCCLQDTQPKIRRRLEAGPVQDEEEHRVFRMRRNDKMSKVMERYDDARGAELGTYVFLSEGGSMINKDKTPDEMEIKDGDQIDAMLHQHGGVDPKDLRLKLQKKHHGLQTRLGGAILDLRQKLSGIKNPQPRSTGNLPNAIREATRPAVMNVSGETKAASNKAIKKKPQQGPRKKILLAFRFASSLG